MSTFGLASPIRARLLAALVVAGAVLLIALVPAVHHHALFRPSGPDGAALRSSDVCALCIAGNDKVVFVAVAIIDPLAACDTFIASPQTLLRDAAVESLATRGPPPSQID